LGGAALRRACARGDPVAGAGRLRHRAHPEGRARGPLPRRVSRLPGLAGDRPLPEDRRYRRDRARRHNELSGLLRRRARRVRGRLHRPLSGADPQASRPGDRCRTAHTRASVRANAVTLALVLLLVVWGLSSPVEAAPEGQITFAAHVTLAPRWLDPAETESAIS